MAARANYLGLDRPDIQYTTKEICRNMSKPQKKHWEKLKRLARYLVMYPKLVWKFKDDERSSEDWLDVYSDSDWQEIRIRGSLPAEGWRRWLGGC